MATNQTISTVLKTISAAYPRFVVEADTVRVWASFVADIDDDLLMAAVTRFISSAPHAFAPSIPEIRAEAASIRREVIGLPDAWTAWDEVRGAPASGLHRRLTGDQDANGAWIIEQRPLVWSHEAVETVARRLGWPQSFPGGADSEVADRAHFVKAYEMEITKRTKATTQMPLVTAYIEDKQREHGRIDVSADMKQLAAGLRRKA